MVIFNCFVSLHQNLYIMNEFTNTIDVKEMGRRFKLVRQKLGLTQTKLGQLLGTSQLMIFRVEKGEHVLSPLFLSFLMFYSQYVSLDGLLAKNFDITDESLFNKNFSINSIVKSKIEGLRQEVIAKIDDVQKQLNYELIATANML